MSHTGAYDNSYASSDLYEKDGERSTQAGITVDLYTQPIPNSFAMPNANTYPALPANAPSAMLRGDLAVVELGKRLTATADGPGTTTCFSSFGNRQKPDETAKDEWCAKYGIAGVIKNTQTDPKDGFFTAHGGTPRINGQQVAILVGGSTTVPYTNPNPVHMGDVVIWNPPTSKTNREYQRSERPVPILGPLDWSLLNGVLRNICIVMINMHQNGKLISASQHNDSGWAKVALQRKRRILITVMVALFVLVKRGFITILTPRETRKRALRDQLLFKLESIQKDVAWTVLVTAANAPVVTVNTAINEYKIALADFDNMSEMDAKSHKYHYYESGQIVSVNRDKRNLVEVENKLIGENTQGESMNTDKNQADSLSWMIHNLGLTGNPGNGRAAKNTIGDILEVHSAGAMDEKERLRSYTSSRATTMNSTLTSDVENFKGQVIGMIAEEEAAYMDLRDRFGKRFVGIALSSAKGTSSSTSYGMAGTLDINLGQKFW